VARSTAFDRAATVHRQAVEATARVVEAEDPASWTIAPDAEKWSPAEIAQHLILSYEVVLSELEGGEGFRVVLPWWKRAPLRWTVLPRILRGKFPRGAPSPKESRPRGGPASPDEAARRLREIAGEFERRLAAAHAERDVRLAHSYFGKLRAPEMLRLAAAHVSHHRAQFPAARPEPKGPVGYSGQERNIPRR
jgi:DinB superfamily